MNAPHPHSSFPDLPLNSLQTCSKLVKQWFMGKSCMFLFFMQFYSISFLLNRNCDYLRRCGALRTSPLLPTPRSSVFWSPLSLSVSLSHNLSFPPEFLWFLLMSVIFIQVWCADWRCCYGHLSLSGPSGCSCGPAGSCGPSPWSYRWLSECLFGLWGACTWTAQWRAASQRPSGPLAMPRESARDL